MTFHLLTLQKSKIDGNGLIFCGFETLNNIYGLLCISYVNTEFMLHFFFIFTLCYSDRQLKFTWGV